MPSWTDLLHPSTDHRTVFIDRRFEELAGSRRSSTNGIAQARGIREVRLYLGRVTVRANRCPDPVVASLYGFFESAQAIRRQITIARDHHLSLFATGDAAKYLSEPPLQLSPLRAAMVLPGNGSTLHGKRLLDVVGSDSYHITRVDYFLSGHGFVGVSFAAGSKTNYGWIARWNTSAVPNGSCTIDATVDDSGGRSIKTPPVDVRVENIVDPGS